MSNNLLLDTSSSDIFVEATNLPSQSSHDCQHTALAEYLCRDRPPDWHSWIHFLKINKPSNEEKKFFWQKQYEENLTGTARAYKPEGSLTSGLKKNMKKYEIWKP